MGKHNDKNKYPIDSQLSLDDYLFGANADNMDRSQNYLLRGIFSTFKTSLNLSSLEYTFGGGGDPELDENDAGYFTTNGDATLAGAISTININKLDLNFIDITAIVQTISGNLSSFIMTLYKPSVTGQIFYFAIDDIVDNGDYYSIGVTNFVGGNNLEDETTYSVSFDLAGIPSVLTEHDPIFEASPAFGITALNITQWNTAFGWGNHADAGYQPALGGTGIVKSTAGTISYLTDNSVNWNTAFGWGNHALEGYLTSETDPVFVASPAFGVTSLKITQWDAAFGWGNHALVGYLTSYTETDPVFVASPAFTITDINKNEWTAAYQWGNHATAGYQLLSEKGAANGYTPLDSGVKIPIEYIPDSIVGQVEYQSTWNASTNTPDVGDPTVSKGHYYVTSVAGTYLTIDYEVGDWIISNGTAWEKVDNTDAVTSVFGRIGAVVANVEDYASFYEPIFSKNTGFNKNFGTTAGTVSEGNHTHTFASLTSKPTTIGGYGITDFNSLGDARWLGLTAKATDSELLDGINSSQFLRSDIADTKTGGDIIFINGPGPAFGTLSNSRIFGSADLSTYWDLASGNLNIRDGSTIRFTFGRTTGSFTATGTGNFGGNVSAQIGIFTGGGGDGTRIYGTGTGVGNLAYYSLYESNGTTRQGYLGFAGGGDSNLTLRNDTSNTHLQLQGIGTLTFFDGTSTRTVWTSGNDGSGSGLDADLLDGVQGSSFLRSDVAGTKTSGNLLFSNNIRIVGVESGGTERNMLFMSTLNNVEVGSSANVTNISGTTVNVLPSTNSTSKDTGALILTLGGLGVEQAIFSGGNMNAPNFVLTSDRRKKKNIKPLKDTPLPIKWKEFELKDFPGEVRYGVIAQEVQKYAPELVSTNGKGELSVKYIDLFAKKLAEKDRQIGSLEERIELLEEKFKLLVNTLT